MWASATSLAFAPSGALRWTSMNSGIVSLPLFGVCALPAIVVLRRDRVADRVGWREAPEALGKVRHRAGFRDPQTLLDQIRVPSMLELGQIGEDRRHDPAVT